MVLRSRHLKVQKDDDGLKKSPCRFGKGFFYQYHETMHAV